MPRPTPGKLSPATERKLVGYCGQFRWFADDIDQAVALGKVEAAATGGDVDATVLRAVRSACKDLRNLVRTVHDSGDRARTSHVAAQSADRRAALRSIHSRFSADLTPGQKRRFARDALIVFAASRGFSRPRLALIFGLARSRIHSIIATFRTTTAPDESAE